MSAPAPPSRVAIALGLLVAALLTATAVGQASAAVPSSIATVGIESATASTSLRPAVRMDAPRVSTTSTTITNRSKCRTGETDAAMQISIVDISYDCPVYAGGQSTIDGGYVTLVDDRGTSPLLATQPGEPGTLWLAAHRTSHGGAFAAVPSLADGAIITLTEGTTQSTYVVVGRAYVEIRNGLVVDGSGQATHDATVDAIIRPDRGGNLAPRLLLQTCDGEDHRWMIYADLVV